MLFHYFDWDLTHQVLFGQPAYALERPALKTGMEDADTLVQN